MAEVDFRVSDAPLSLSFAGGGFLAIYEIGVIQGLLDQAPILLQSAQKVYGASSGSIIAAAVVCELNLVEQTLPHQASFALVLEVMSLLYNLGFRPREDDVKKCFYEAAKDARRTIFGPFSPGCNMVRTLQKELYRILPENSHQMATGRLYVSLTRLVDGQNVMVSEYHSKKELVQALICSCFLPVYCGFIPPSFRGVHYVDGGFSNLQPHSDLEAAITVSPFTGEIDICPRDCPAIFYCLHIMHGCFQFSIENLCRLGYAVFPPNSRVLDEFYAQGFQDAIFFLHRNNIFEIDYVAKAVTLESVGVFHQKDLFHISEGNSCQETGTGVLHTSKETTSKDYSKQHNSVTSNIHRNGQKILQQLPGHCSKAVLHAQTQPGLLNSVTGLQHLMFMKPPTRMALAFCKRLEQLWQFLKEINWFGIHSGRTKRWFVQHSQDKVLRNHMVLEPQRFA